MKSRFKNVYWHAAIGKWVAKVKVDYRSNHLGSFDAEEAAHAAVILFKAANRITGPDGQVPALADAFEYRDGHLYARYASSYVKPGDQVGCVSPPDGYVMVGHGSATYRAHHVVWLMFHGPIPAGMEIDHVNGDRADNRLENLRVVTKTENARNRRLPKNNTTGEIGVKRKPGGKFEVVVGGRYVGQFRTLEEARAARQAAAAARGYHPNHGRKKNAHA